MSLDTVLEAYGNNPLVRPCVELLHDGRLMSADRLVWIAVRFLAADTDAFVHATIHAIGKHARIDPREVPAAIQHLLHAGWLDFRPYPGRETFEQYSARSTRRGESP
jgi:hypothetical protein